MSLKYLAIDKDKRNHEMHSMFWKTRNISAKRVDTVAEGIKEVATNDYLFIGINSSSVKGYQTDFSFIRRSTDIPIFISANKYDPEEHEKVTVLGADLYGQLYANPHHNYTTVTAIIKRLNDIWKKRDCPLKILSYGNLIILLQQRQVFVGEKQIRLTRQDYDLLHMFVNNQDCALSYEEIYHSVWMSEYDESANLVIKNAITRLRKKIGDEDGNTFLFDNVWGYGYILASGA